MDPRQTALELIADDNEQPQYHHRHLSHQLTNKRLTIETLGVSQLRGSCLTIEDIDV